MLDKQAALQAAQLAEALEEIAKLRRQLEEHKETKERDDQEGQQAPSKMKRGRGKGKGPNPYTRITAFVALARKVSLEVLAKRVDFTPSSSTVELISVRT